MSVLGSGEDGPLTDIEYTDNKSAVRVSAVLLDAEHTSNESTDIVEIELTGEGTGTTELQVTEVVELTDLNADQYNTSVGASGTVEVSNPSEDDESDSDEGSDSNGDDGSSGGGGGGAVGGGAVGGGGAPVVSTPDPIQQTVTVTNDSSTTTVSAVESNQKVAITVNQTETQEDGDLSQVNLTSTAEARNVQIQISQPNSSTSNLPAGDLNATVIKYAVVDIENLPAAEETPGTFRFTVSEERLETMGIESEDIQMYRYTNESWETIDTAYLGDNQYQSETPGFSWFVVGTDESTTSTNTTDTTEDNQTNTTSNTSGDSQTNTTDTTEDNQTNTEDVQENGTVTTAESTDDTTPGFGIVIALISLMLAPGILRQRN